MVTEERKGRKQCCLKNKRGRWCIRFRVFGKVYLSPGKKEDSVAKDKRQHLKQDFERMEHITGWLTTCNHVARSEKGIDKGDFVCIFVFKTPNCH